MGLRHGDLPAPPRATRPRPHDAQESRADGLDAHGSRGGPAGLRADGGLLCSPCEGRRGADRHRGHRAQPRRAPRAEGLAAVVPLAGGQAPHHHRRRAPRRRQDRAADPARRPLRLPPAGGRAVGDQERDQPVQAACAHPLRHPPHDRFLRALREARQGGRLRRRRDHGLRGVPDQPVHRAAHQPAHRRVGRLVREPHPLPAGDRARRARALRARLHHHLSVVDARPGRGREHVGRGRGARQGGRGRRRDDHQHRHRLARGAHPDDRDARPARRVRLGDAPAQGRGARAARRHQPHQRPGGRRGDPRARRRRHGVDGAAASCRPGLRRQGRDRPCRRDQHVHRVQPGLPRPHLRAQARELPRQPVRRAGDRAQVRTRRAAQDDCRRRRRPGGARRGRDRGRARPQGHAVRRGPARSAASSTWRSASPARRSSRRRSATSARASPSWAWSSSWASGRSARTSATSTT